jgi:hypothetical protein
MEFTPQLLISLATMLATGGAAWAGVKYTLNGTVKKVDSIDQKLDNHIESTAKNREEVIQRLTRVETRIGDG